MEKYLQRALIGPGIFEILFGAAASLLVGIFIAFVWLASSGESLHNPSTEGARINPVPFVAGETTVVNRRQWESKLQAFLEGQSGQLAISESELNAWSEANPPAAQVPVDSFIKTGRLNFRIVDGMLQVATPTTLRLFGGTVTGQLQSRGAFIATEAGQRFEPRETYFGSLALHRFPNVHRWLLARVSRQPLVPEDVLGGWSRVSRASIEGQFFTVTIP
ncbi:MAG: hypothetical protein FJ382_00215 [Verrucomicrobia bacterium]|nr:hypothetical protein [Verrucomicrobiota bacterium]